MEIKYVENNNISCIFSKMAAKMAAENLNLMYISSAFEYKDEWSVDWYEIKNVDIKYVENNKNSCNMAAKYQNLMYLCSAIRCKEEWSVHLREFSKICRVLLCRNYYKQLHVFQNGNKDGHQKVWVERSSVVQIQFFSIHFNRIY